MGTSVRRLHTWSRDGKHPVDQPVGCPKPETLGWFRSFVVVRASTLWKQRHGECSKADKTVVLGRHLQGRQLLDTSIHELLHAANWDLSEKFVDRAASDIAAFLWKQGWRPKKRKK